MNHGGIPEASSALIIDPADVPTMWSASAGSQPVSVASAYRPPVIHAPPTIPPAPSTRPTRIEPAPPCAPRPAALPVVGRQRREDPRVAVDHGCVVKLHLAVASVSGQAVEAPGRELPEHVRVALVHLARLGDAHGAVLGAVVARDAVRLEQDPAAVGESLTQQAQHPERVLDAVQDPEAVDEVEPLVELVHVERVQHPVLDIGVEEVLDRAEPLAALELNVPAALHPLDVLLVVDREHAIGATILG